MTDGVEGLGGRDRLAVGVVAGLGQRDRRRRVGAVAGRRERAGPERRALAGDRRARRERAPELDVDGRGELAEAGDDGGVGDLGAGRGLLRADLRGDRRLAAHDRRLGDLRARGLDALERVALGDRLAVRVVAGHRQRDRRGHVLAVARGLDRAGPDRRVRAGDLVARRVRPVQRGLDRRRPAAEPGHADRVGDLRRPERRSAR